MPAARGLRGRRFLLAAAAAGASEADTQRHLRSSLPLHRLMTASLVLLAGRAALAAAHLNMSALPDCADTQACLVSHISLVCHLSIISHALRDADKPAGSHRARRAAAGQRPC